MRRFVHVVTLPRYTRISESASTVVFQVGLTEELDVLKGRLVCRRAHVAVASLADTVLCSPFAELFTVDHDFERLKLGVVEAV
jgi:hypothetical protein